MLAFCQPREADKGQHQKPDVGHTVGCVDGGHRMHSSDGQAADRVSDGDLNRRVWERDNSVHEFDLPHPLCMRLLSLLVSSTGRLPMSRRRMRGFHVSGYG